MSVPEDANHLAILGGRIPDGSTAEIGIGFGAGTVKGAVIEKTTILFDVKAEGKKLFEKLEKFIKSFLSDDEAEE